MKKILIVFVLIFCMSSVFAISISPSYLKSSVKVGEKYDSSLMFSCEEKNCVIQSYGDFFSLSEYSGTGNFDVDVFFKNVSEGVYAGSVLAEGIIVPVILEVNSEKSDFAVVFDVSSADKNVEKYSTIFPKINLYNLKNELMDVKVSSYVYDLRGDILYSSEDSFSINDKYSYVKPLLISDDFLFGNYVFAVVVESKNGVLVSSYSFGVVSEKDSRFNVGCGVFVLIVVSIWILILGIIFYIYTFYERKKS